MSVTVERITDLEEWLAVPPPQCDADLNRVWWISENRCPNQARLRVTYWCDAHGCRHTGWLCDRCWALMSPPWGVPVNCNIDGVATLVKDLRAV